jgi:hypothetical protein
MAKLVLNDDRPALAVIGDVHGHLQLAPCVAARWQRQLGVRFEAVLLCGDVGTFTEYSQLDGATLAHAKNNPCELEFLQQWATDPPAPWLAKIFDPADDGLGLCCPVVMVHGNHEGFAHLATLAPRRRPAEVLEIEQLPAVVAGRFIRYLPSGWKMTTASGLIVAGVGGMEPGQRRARYHPMAFVDESAVESLLDGSKADILITHQGPSAVQGEHGSPTLQALLDADVARVWFHGHSTPNPQPIDAGPNGACRVVPLGDVAFAGRGKSAGEPGLGGWAYLTVRDGVPVVRKETPPFWRDLRQSHWARTSDGGLVAPDLARFAWP